MGEAGVGAPGPALNSSPESPSAAQEVAVPASSEPLRKVLFFDVDGVLHAADGIGGNASKTGDKLLPEKLAFLREVVETTGAELVMTSSWRKKPKRMDMVQEAFAAAGLKPLVHVAPTLRFGKNRYSEIRAWMNASGGSLEFFAVVDDLDVASQAEQGWGDDEEGDEFLSFGDHCVQTDWQEGLTKFSVRQLQEALKRPWKKV